MRKLLITSICAMGLALSATNADAITVTLEVGDAYYVGSVIPGIPPSEEQQAAYINQLVSMGPGQTTTIGDNDFSTVDGIDCSDCPDANDEGTSKVEDGSFSDILVNGWTYIIAKYDQEDGGSFVWYLGDLSSTDFVTLPSEMGGHDISHYTLFKSGQPQTIPDGGATLGLLGLAMLGLGYLRRRMA